MAHLVLLGYATHTTVGKTTTACQITHWLTRLQWGRYNACDLGYFPGIGRVFVYYEFISIQRTRKDARESPLGYFSCRATHVFRRSV